MLSHTGFNPCQPLVEATLCLKHAGWWAFIIMSFTSRTLTLSGVARINDELYRLSFTKQ